MPFFMFLWNELSEDHIAQHDVTADEFEAVVCDPAAVDKSRSSGREIAFYEMLDETTVLPVTAYEVE